jgi:hypothetical protein
MIRRLALTAALILALPTAAAHALTGTDAGLYVGEQVWGKPACGQPHVEVSTPTEYEAAHPAAEFGDSVPLAWADETRCVIVINREYARLSIRTAVKRCHVIVHEWGHLTGREHSENPRSVMYGDDVVTEGRERVGKRVRWVTSGAFKPCVTMAAPGMSVG